MYDQEDEDENYVSPDFAYDVINDKVLEDKLDDLDLVSVKDIFNIKDANGTYIFSTWEYINEIIDYIDSDDYLKINEVFMDKYENIKLNNLNEIFDDHLGELDFDKEELTEILQITDGNGKFKFRDMEILDEILCAIKDGKNIKEMFNDETDNRNVYLDQDYMIENKERLWVENHRKSGNDGNIGIKGLGKCGKCGNEELAISAKQTRSGDEPTTIFYKCINIFDKCKLFAQKVLLRRLIWQCSLAHLWYRLHGGY